jgi:hypothetical protein
MSGFRSRIGRLPSCAIVDFDRLRRQLVIKLFVPLRDQRTDRKGLQARRGRRGPRARFDMPASPDALGRRRSLLARLVLRKSGHFSTRLHGPPDAPSGRKARERSGDGATVCETLDYTPHIAREERAGLLIGGFASVGNFGVPALTGAQERVRSPITSTATPVSAAAAKQQH